RLTDPTGDSAISLPYTLIAEVSSFEPDRVIFAVSGVEDTSYSKSFTDSDGSDGWSVSWNDTVTAGKYSITLSAVKLGIDIVQSTPVNIEVVDLAPVPTPPTP